ncbi:MAG TPA: UrcA family protein [Phenylobacterium sp.]|uniref:UrcA family protein n=1 Tax=Phenylobacterium sp. TaxID=1871053 RepID=UPI002D09197C|nr:UrcA family protein [Phenylobacterium sp.]HSV02775.1 UrcA family protein [Phenylobacterium sp.]
MLKAFATIATTALVLGCAGAATQAAAGDAPKTVVQYSDLNLASASGQAQLAARISAAASALCGPAPQIVDLAAVQARRACLRAAVASSTPSAQQATALQVRSRERVAASGEQ